MADVIHLTCWPTPDRLALGIRLRSLGGEWHSAAEELVQLDTGYSEALLAPYRLFEVLNLQRRRLPAPSAPIGSIVTGQVLRFMEAWAEVHIPQTGDQHRLIVQTFAGNTHFLIGRAFLRKFKVLLDGPGGQMCLMIASE